MAEYRIKVDTRANGDVWYSIQERFLGIFWRDSKFRNCYGNYEKIYCRGSEAMAHELLAKHKQRELDLIEVRKACKTVSTQIIKVK